MPLDVIADANPPLRLPFGESFNMPDFRLRMTAGGTCLYREVKVPIWADDKFHQLWKKNTLAFRQRGFVIAQENGRWTLSQWMQKHPDVSNVYTLTEIGQEKVDLLKGFGELALVPQKLDLIPLPPEFEAKLLDYQIEPARQLLRALVNGLKEWGYMGAWDASEMGTGKTYTSLAAALAVCQTLGMEVFVVCPLAVIGSSPSYGGRGSGWRGAFAHFNATPRGIYNYETLRTGNRDFVEWRYYEGEEKQAMKRFEWQLDPAKTFLIFDEAQRCKKVGTHNQALAMAAMRQRFPVIFVSGTMGSDPTHMRATGRAIGLHTGSNYVPFLQKNGCYGVKKSGKDWKFCGGTKGRRILQHLHYTVFPKRGARIRIQDLGDRFPETQILVEAYQTGATQAIEKAFNDCQRAIERLEKQGDLNEEQKEGVRLNAYMRAWHDSETLKVQTIIPELIEDELEEGRSVAVFLNFTDARESLMARFKSTCGIYGTQKPDDRTRSIDGFQNDTERLIFCNSDAGGVGVSLHDINGEFPRTAIILPTNKPDVLKQVLYRVHRSGGLTKSRQIIVYAAGTVEERICNTVRTRIAQIDTLNDGDLNPPKSF